VQAAGRGASGKVLSGRIRAGGADRALQASPRASDFDRHVAAGGVSALAGSDPLRGERNRAVTYKNGKKDSEPGSPIAQSSTFRLCAQTRW